MVGGINQGDVYWSKFLISSPTFSSFIGYMLHFLKYLPLLFSPGFPDDVQFSETDEEVISYLEIHSNF